MFYCIVGVLSKWPVSLANQLPDVEIPFQRLSLPGMIHILCSTPVHDPQIHPAKCSFQVFHLYGQVDLPTSYRSFSEGFGSSSDDSHLSKEGSNCLSYSSVFRALIIAVLNWRFLIGGYGPDR